VEVVSPEVQDSSQEGYMKTLVQNTQELDKEIVIANALRCCHCNSTSCVETSETWVKLQDVFNCQINRDEANTLENYEIKILDALEIIFKFSSSCSCKQLFNSIKNREDLFMCSKCVGMLSQLYEMYHSFKELSMRARSILGGVFSSSSITEIIQDGKSQACSNDDNLHNVNGSTTSFSPLHCVAVEKPLETLTKVEIIINGPNQKTASSEVVVQRVNNICTLTSSLKQKRPVTDTSTKTGIFKKHCTRSQNANNEGKIFTVMRLLHCFNLCI